MNSSMPRLKVMQMPEIKIKYLRGVESIEMFKNGDWVDLRAAEDIKYNSGSFFMIPLGVAMQLPEGYEAIVAPRSSTFKKYGIIMVNSVGVIDESYCGNNDEWQFPAYAVYGGMIHKNERICQFRIIKHQPKLHLIPVEDLGNEDRGGFGSSGSI